MASVSLDPLQDAKNMLSVQWLKRHGRSPATGHTAWQPATVVLGV